MYNVYSSRSHLICFLDILTHFSRVILSVTKHKLTKLLCMIFYIGPGGAVIKYFILQKNILYSNFLKFLFFRGHLIDNEMLIRRYQARYEYEYEDVCDVIVNVYETRQHSSNNCTES